MRAFYLDTPQQGASLALLAELGVLVGKEHTTGLPETQTMEISKGHLGAAFKETVAELKREHRFKATEGKEALVVHEGSLSVDLRDSADEWIRIVLSKDDAVVLPNTLYRRLVLLEDGFVVLERRSSAGSRESNKLDLFVRDYRFSSSADEKLLLSLAADAQKDSPDVRQLIVELCAQFYELGWVQGTGGSISIRHGNRVYMTPSGVQKERILPEELYVLDMSGNQLFTPDVKPGRSNLKLTACAPLFFHSYRIRDAGAVIHSHGMECVLATLLFEGQTEFRITHQEMIKGIQGHGYLSELVIPIIENTPHEEDLADSLGEAIRKYPKATAVLVRRHGIYVWGPTWMSAKTQAECYHYLFKLAVEMHRLGIDFTKVPDSNGVAEAAPAKPRGGLDSLVMEASAISKSCCGGAHAHGNGHVAAPSKPGVSVKYVLLDIEGTTTSISFVHDVLFPFAKAATEAHMKGRMADPELQADIAALRKQAQADLASGQSDAPSIPSPGEASDADIADAAIRNVYWQMASDRKTTALKQLQGHIWRAGYESGALKSHIYDDVVPALERWTKKGLKVSIYSSGSREAQRLLFANTESGDLRRYLSCYFDTTTGGKRQSESYTQIALSLGVDDPSEVLFLTDVAEEATAAKAAGMSTVLSLRPGNAPLPASLGEDVPRVTSFDQVDAIMDALAAAGARPKKLQ